MSDKMYSVLKWICITCLPAINTFLIVVLPLLDVDAETTRVVTGVIAALDTLLGTLIGVSSVQYAKNQAEEGKNE